MSPKYILYCSESCFLISLKEMVLILNENVTALKTENHLLWSRISSDTSQLREETAQLREELPFYLQQQMTEAREINGT